ncbi:TonB-dependent receptor [Novosphingobium sp. JCM 18896]|uniref:TonB-dependent receptor n=1 Tax=Novosphingobium sp. JCM 18896 TaxID=2989731 RepID=UPI00222167BE|nr:TonB-dependent receptor [Novosphingobium sp. JCM 18896]MCW1430661.1 TonB-dependent receptor [Novosphingobium sp. JCM 18896]
MLALSADPSFAEEAERPAGAEADSSAAIIVTARRRAENLQDVPVAVSVVRGEDLDRAYTVNTQGVTNLVPVLNYSSANPRNTSFTIRGLGSSVVAVSQANDGLEPGVGFYVDQVYHARPATAAFDFSDIEQIEVLRGPQGTLFGKNTTAGAINITSRAPTFTPEANQEISYGERNWLQVKAAGSLPLIDDTLALRVSGLMTRRDGVITNVRQGGHKQNNIGNQAVRGQLLFKPSEAFQLRLIADFANFQNECCTQVFVRVGTSLRAAARQYPSLAAGLGYVPPSTNPYDRLVDIDAELGVDTNEGGVTAIADWDFGPVTLTSVSAWRFWNWDAANDRDYTGINIQVTQHILSRQDQYSQELRLASNGDGPFRYVGGLYFFHQTLDGRPISIYGPQAAYWLIGPTFTSGTTTVNVPANLLDGYGTDGRTHFTTDSYAAFAELNYDVTSRFTVTGGLRYTHEKKYGNYDSPVFGGPELTGTAAQITALTNARLSILRRQTYEARDSDGSLSGRANLAYRFTDGLMAYASFARGFKSGGINMSGLPLTSANLPALTTAVVKPERNTTYEVGLKTQFLDNRVTFNLTGFYTQVRNFQATIVDSSQTVALRGYLSNIPEVVVKGIEADAVVRPVDGLTIRGSLAYSHGEYTDYPAGPCPLEVQTAATTACNLTGKPLVGLPRWVETVSADYTVPLGKGGNLVFHADTAWRSSYYGDPSLSRFTLIDGYNLTNASIGYRSDKGWEISVFARNLFDKDYLQNLTIQAGNSGLIVGTPSDPRTVGVTFRAWQ